MKVRVSDISPQGMRIQEELPLERLNERMAEGRGNDIVFTSAPRADITLFNTASGAQLKGVVTSTYQQQCGLCLQTVQREVSVDASFVLKERPAEPSHIPFEDDVGVVYYLNDHAELDDVLEEALILSLSLFWHPEFSATGRCSICNKSKRELGLEEKTGNVTLGSYYRRPGFLKSCSLLSESYRLVS